MGFDHRFTLGLIGWILALLLAVLATIAAFATPDLGAVRLVALAGTGAAATGLWRHVTRTNVAIARFVDALRLGDFTTHFAHQGGAGFGQLGVSLNAALDRLRAGQDKTAGELRYLDALVDDVPVALLRIDADGHVHAANKAARRLFRTVQGTEPADFAACGATFVRRLSAPALGDELLLITLDGRPQHVLLRAATLDRLGQRTWAITIQPIQRALDAVEMATQTDLVRVLTHEILNSLTPVTSLAQTASALLDDPALADDPRIADARVAVTTLSRRAAGLGHFIEAYREIARPPVIERRSFAARPWADELARLFAAAWPGIPLAVSVEPAELALEADPDMLAQVVINLLRNAGQAVEKGETPRVALTLDGGAGHPLIEVADNGPGIPESLRQDIFLPFFTTRATGTGVGLNLARQIVVAHGGSIDLVEGPLDGATFRIRL